MPELVSLPPRNRAVLVAVQLPHVSDDEVAESLTELGRLARTLGLDVVAEPVVQRRDALDPGAVLGTGKREELAQIVRARDAGVVLVDHEIGPSQARNLEKACGGVEVLDRTATILEIFRRHARSRAAKAQVEMVRLKYLAPRLREQAKGKGDRQRGGIGGKGAGESALELDRRKIRDRIAELGGELAALEVERRTRRARRRDVCRAALVGYTNAGKSTLMRALTGSDVLVADKLFATLDTTVRALDPPTRPRILVSDTVGFIKKLPHDLVASFKSTLDEALEASLLVHVVDASDPGFERQLHVTEEVLAEIGAGDVPRLIVFNKLDRVADEAGVAAALALRWPGSLCLSARRPEDIARLRAALIDAFSADLVETEVHVPYDQQARRADIFAACQVLEEKYVDTGVVFRVRAPRGFA
ncbi:MAG TPA: GTPase HflX [Haliangiales bacterium]|nr:GTPase HflX [Haliangiales bacterium]